MAGDFSTRTNTALPDLVAPVSRFLAVAEVGQSLALLWFAQSFAEAVPARPTPQLRQISTPSSPAKGHECRGSR